MMVFALAAAGIAVFLFVAGSRQPRLAMFVAAILWLAYAVWEHQISTGVLCDKDCNIRVDLVLFFPVLGVATFLAYRASQRPLGQPTFAGWLLGAIGVMIAALLVGAFGYTAYAWAAGAAALAIGAYAVKVKVTTKPAERISEA